MDCPTVVVVYSRSGFKKATCFCYILTCILLSIVIYLATIAYIHLAETVVRLQEDIIEIYYISLESKNKPCPEEFLNNAIQKYKVDLKNDLLEAKQVLNQLKNVKYKNNLNNMEYDDETDDEQPNYALESLGAIIEHVEDEPLENVPFYLSMFGMRLTYQPRSILNPSTEPGNCYAFRGTKSVVIIGLMDVVFVDSVTIGHISVKENPSGNLFSAPKDFSVYGLNNVPKDENEFYFGSFMYDINSRKRIQNFKFDKLSPIGYKYIKFNFTTNHGHPNYTCVYRVGIHGTLKTNMKIDL